VRGADGGSGQTIPLRIIPARGQVPENFVEPPMKEVCDVLHDDVPGSHVANDARHLLPEPAPRPLDPDARPGPRDIGAGEPSGEDIAEGEVGDASNVSEPLDAGPVLVEDAPGVLVCLTLPDGPEAPGPLKAKLQSPDPGEEGADGEGDTQDDPPVSRDERTS